MKKECPRCLAEEQTLKKMNFGDQVIAALVVWGELDRSLIDASVCSDCIEDLRDTLIERAEELSEETTAQKTPVAS